MPCALEALTVMKVCGLVYRSLQPQGGLCSSTSLMGVSSHVGRNFATMAPTNSSVESRSWSMLGASRNCLSSTGRVGRGKMSRTLCCPVRIGKHGRSGKTKKEFETVATKTGVIWFVDEDEVVKRILEVVLVWQSRTKELRT